MPDGKKTGLGICPAQASPGAAGFVLQLCWTALVCFDNIVSSSEGLKAPVRIDLCIIAIN